MMMMMGATSLLRHSAGKTRDGCGLCALWPISGRQVILLPNNILGAKAINAKRVDNAGLSRVHAGCPEGMAPCASRLGSRLW